MVIKTVFFQSILAKRKIRALNCLSPKGEFSKPLEQALDGSKTGLDKAKRGLDHNHILFFMALKCYQSFCFLKQSSMFFLTPCQFQLVCNALGCVLDKTCEIVAFQGLVCAREDIQPLGSQQPRGILQGFLGDDFECR